MKKQISFLMTILLVLSLIAVGCKNTTDGKSTQTSTDNNTVKQEEKKAPLDALKEEFKKQGFTVGDNETVAFEMVGATSGYKFKLDNELIEIYYYDEKKLTEEGKELLKQAKTGSINMSGFNIPVKFKNNFMITRVDEHSKKDKILEVFNNFKY